MRSNGARDVLVYCGNAPKCYHHARLSADRWPDEVIFGELERRVRASWREHAAGIGQLEASAMRSRRIHLRLFPRGSLGRLATLEAQFRQPRPRTADMEDVFLAMVLSGVALVITTLAMLL
jgi:hypothetical protein